MKVHGLHVIMEKDEDGCYTASCPILHDCRTTQVGTFDQALAMIGNAIELNIESRLKLGESIPKKYQNSGQNWHWA